MEYLPELAKQGIGYLLFVVALIGLITKDRQLQDLQEKRVRDIAESRDVFVGTAKDMLNSLSNLQKTVDTLTSIVDGRGRK